MDISFTPIAAAGLAILLIFTYYSIKNKDVVSGPIGLPYFGLYLCLTDKNVRFKLEEYKKQYGDIFSFTYTGRLFINLGSIKAMREILLNKSDCFEEKYKDTNLMTQMIGKGVTFVNGEPWRILRKFFILKFKEYGLSIVQNNLAGPLYDSLNTTIEDLKNLKGKPVNIVEFLGQRSAVTIRKAFFGENGITSENLRKIIAAYTESLEGNSGVNLLLLGPLARLLFEIKPSFRKNLNAHKTLVSLVRKCVLEVESSMNEAFPTCVIDEFYKERNKRRRENDPTWKIFSDDALVESMLQFIGDGIQAVAALIAGILNTLLEYPDEQEKLYSELIEVIGPNRQPSAEDRPSLPYTNAFLNEYLRYKSFIDFFPSLECTKETTIRGQRIPAGSILLLNFWSAHHDAKTFDEPDAFNPSRYMLTAGKSKAESPVVFGMGKRSCSGESFVMLQAFLFLATIVKNFKIIASNAQENHCTEQLIVGKLVLIFVPRTEN